MKRSFRLAILLCIFSRIVVAADQWPEFRGPYGDGNAGAKALPIRFSEAENIRWKVPIHGKGWSSPVIWNDQIWLTTASEDGKKMYGVCVDRKTGKIVHDLLVFENEKPRFCHPTNSYASCTPTIEQGRVYLHFGSYGTACVDTTSGKVLWTQRSLECNHWRGPGSSPILHGSALYVAFDGYDQQYVVAMDKATGKILWKTDREIDYGTDNGDRKKAYSTGLILEHNGTTQLISPSAVETIAYNVKDGEVIWRVRHGGMNAAARPVFGHGLVYIAAGSGQNSLIAVKPDGRGDVTGSHISWNLAKSVPRRPSPLLLGDHLFMITDDGVVSCVKAKSGEIVWRERLGGSYRASPLHANGLIYFFDLNGEIPVIKADTKGLEIVARNQLDHGFQASPAVAGNALYVRSIKHLYCLEKSKR